MMKRRPSGLGRGLGALIPQREESAENDINAAVTPAVLPPQSTTDMDQAPQGTYRQVAVGNIEINPQQPRRHFDHAAMEDLVSSIQEHGVVEPLIVTELPQGQYELIAGERRLRASKIAGLDTVPAVVRTASEQDKLEIALIENIQRHDLNPIEEAIAYKRLMDEFGMTQDEVGKRVGKSRPQVANLVRLLQLPEEIQQALMDRKISASNARTLLSLSTDEERMHLLNAMIAGNFTVRQTEARVGHPRRARNVDPNVMEQERRLRESLGHRVDVKPGQNGGGEIKIYFHSDEDLSELTSKLAGDPELD
ncbi:ParB/RepB/Spo0J family partition protein [Candidatus Uhrbacteria bacterium]|nr:ParB/RepB/Spo0J family partition protein [Candidatus Uhrbacteria bacterium]MBD3284363.1 ParB/RepB/Spo0J family partition protein [Candidatus Uhrbacteria bacterium]